MPSIVKVFEISRVFSFPIFYWQTLNHLQRRAACFPARNNRSEKQEKPIKQTVKETLEPNCCSDSKRETCARKANKIKGKTKNFYVSFFYG